MKAQFIEAEEGSHQLKRHLNAIHLTALGIGAIIGAGIFVITGQAAALYAGPGITLAFILSAIVCVFAGLCFAELSSLIPIAGGSYVYSYVALGEFPAWIVGWSLIGQYLFSSATVAVGWGGYCVSILNDFGITLSDSLAHSPISYLPDVGWHFTGAWVNLPAMILVALVGVLISVGIKAASMFNNIMVVVKLSTLALFIILGISFIHTENWSPFIPANTGEFGDFGWSGIFRAAGLLFFAYLGFDTVASLAQDAVNPQKDLPRGILGSLAICTIAYIATALVLTGVVSYKLLNVPDPMSVALDAMGSSLFWLKSLVKCAILAGLASVVLVQLLALTRVLMATGKDGLLPTRCCKINQKTSTPLFSSVLTALGCLIVAGLFPVSVLSALVSITTLFLFAIVCLGVLILRYLHPEFHRPFKVPLVPYIPLVGILACLFAMASLPLVSWIQLIAWVIVGLFIYFGYGLRYSKLRQ